MANEKAQQTQVSTKIRPLWQVVDGNIELLNATFMVPDQLKYLKAFVGKKATDDRVEKLKAAIIANEGELPKPAPPKNDKKQTEKQPPAAKTEAEKAKAEAAPASEGKTGKAQSDKKADKKVDKPKSESKKEQPKTAQYSEKVYNEGDVIPCAYNDRFAFKVLSPDTKPQLNMWAVVPEFQGLTEEQPRDLYLRFNFFGKNTVWLVEPFETENMIPIGPKAAVEHYLDEENQPEDQWIPFYLCELVDVAKEQPKPEPPKGSEDINELPPNKKKRVRVKAKDKASA